MPLKLNFSSLPSLPLSKRGELPATSCVYFIVQANKILYIGKAINLKARWNNHHKATELEKLRGVKIAWIAISDKGLREEWEKALIKHFNPVLNSKTKYKNYNQKLVKRSKNKKVIKKRL